MGRPNVKLTLGPFGGSEENKVEINGEDLTGGVKSLQIHAGTQTETVLILHYGCHKVEIEGEMRVRHVCGFGHVKDED